MPVDIATHRHHTRRVDANSHEVTLDGEAGRKARRKEEGRRLGEAEPDAPITSGRRRHRRAQMREHQVDARRQQQTGVVEAGRDVQHREHGLGRLNVATGRLESDPSPSVHDLLDGGTSQVVVGGAAMTEGMRHVRNVVQAQRVRNLPNEEAERRRREGEDAILREEWMRQQVCAKRRLHLRVQQPGRTD